MTPGELARRCRVLVAALEADDAAARDRAMAAVLNGIDLYRKPVDPWDEDRMEVAA